jgi:hypothetical protein
MKNIHLISKRILRHSLSISTVLFCLLLPSCEKHPDNLTLLLDQSGIVSFKVTDDNLNGVQGAKISIYSSIPEKERIYYGSTDSKGICAIGKILQGQYTYFISAINNKKTYHLRESFQVIAGEDKIIEVNPFLNIGDARVRIEKGYSMEPIADVYVAIIPHANYSNVTYYFQELIEEAYAIEKTNSEGWVEFQNLPAGPGGYSFEYSVLVYFDSSTYDYPTSNNYVYITRGVKQDFTIRVNL